MSFSETLGAGQARVNKISSKKFMCALKKMWQERNFIFTIYIIHDSIFPLWQRSVW